MEKFIFRVFDVKSKKMINNIQSLIFAHHGLVVSYNTMLNADIKVYNGIVSQYTGKTDKNHTKIFTRDILEVEFRKTMPGSGTYKKLEYVESMEKLFLLMYGADFFACKLLGNRDESPELYEKFLHNPFNK